MAHGDKVTIGMNMGNLKKVHITKKLSNLEKNTLGFILKSFMYKTIMKLVIIETFINILLHDYKQD